MDSRVIMVVDDHVEERMMLRYILEAEGYRVLEVQDEETVVDLVQFHQPDLIVMDRNMPRKSGLEISQELKGKISASQIPIIMVTAADKLDDKVQAFEEGVDDYICKPYEPRELLARIKAMLRSSKGAIDRNPTTLLPGASALEEEICRRLGRNDLFAICHADLDNFKPYADSHGFSLANDVIKMVGRAISEQGDRYAAQGVFVAHVGGDDFIVISPPGLYQAIGSSIIGEFEREIVKYFSPEELSRGGYRAKSRAGEEMQFPLMTISIGVITTGHRRYLNSTELGVELSTAKRKAKTLKKSNIFLWDPSGQAVS
ncbi:MAG: response regulator [Candidatus Eremiobacteraeota bacterium]|nr:response regulator [Candidatus Eremiobacteraeota bacterium]